MGESSSDDSSAAEEEQGIAGELGRSDVADVSNISDSDSYDAQFTADNLENRGLDPQGFMSPENFAQTTQGGAPDPNALSDGFYDSVSSVANQVAANLPNIATSPLSPVSVEREIRVSNQPNAPTFFVSDLGRDLANQAALQALTGAQVDNFALANLGMLPTPSVLGTAPITMTNDPDLSNEFSDFNFSGSIAAQGLRDRAAPTGGILPTLDLVLGFPAQRQLNRLDQGFVPRLRDGQIIGTEDFSFGSNQTEGLLGQNPLLSNIYGSNQDQMDMMSGSDDGGEKTVPPVTNPLTGVTRCPEGYIFDDDLQACRVDTGRKKKADDKAPSGERFFRQTALDIAPSNLPSGFDFDAANKRFTSSFAVNPSNFNRPPTLTGFTPFSSFRPFA